MRFRFILILGLAIFVSGWYFYRIAGPCIVPKPYSIGVVDERFALDKDAIESLLLESKSVWEDAIGRQLFVYQENSDFKINFIYDERQSKTDQAEVTRTTLDKKETASAKINAQYQELITQYDKLKNSYDSSVSVYETKLADFNETVAKYNEKGGAPDSVFNSLKTIEQNLGNEASALEKTAETLSDLAKQINVVSEQSNAIIAEYNKSVQQYNKNYTGEEEFTQGDYQGDSINIYNYQDVNELRNVFVHEWGHAIGLKHVEGNESIMYYLMEDQPKSSALSVNDLAALNSQCLPNNNWRQRLHKITSSLFIKLNLL
jgi:uncharacterized protein YukE